MNIIPEETIQEMKSALERASVKILEEKQIDYGVQWKIEKDSQAEMLRIYVNKKGRIRPDLSLIQDNKMREEVAAALKVEQQNSKIKNKDFHHDKINYPLIGTDESGKGDFFGPLVAAGVYVDEKSSYALLLVGVQDSKKIKDNRIYELAKEIQIICKDKFAVIEIAPEKYNLLYQQFRQEGKKLNTLLAWGHAKAIEEILTTVPCELAIADQFADEKFILSKLQERGKKIELIQQTKAEEYVAVAAASILARSRFLWRMKKLSEDFHLNLPKGASNKVIDAGKLFVKKFGKESLRKVAKLHFKTTEQIIGQIIA